MSLAAGLDSPRPAVLGPWLGYLPSVPVSAVRGGAPECYSVTAGSVTINSCGLLQ